MKKVIFIIALGLLSCKKDDPVVISNNNSCSEIKNPVEILSTGNYNLKLISLIGNETGTLELVDQNNNSISKSNDFSYQLVQLQNGNNCWETTTIQKVVGVSDNTYSGLYNGIPSWAVNSKTKVIIKINISGTSYYIIDNDITKSKMMAK